MSKRSISSRATAIATAVLLAGVAVGASSADATTTDASAAATATGAVTPVPRVEVIRYLGDWYQVAAVPAIYELQCAKDARANYVLDSPGTLGVTNTCTDWLGGTSTVLGKARIDNAPKNSALSVSFFALFGHQIYTGTNYVVFGLDKDYRWALVGDPARNSGFVLARTPALTSAQTRTILAKIAGAGYSACAFKVTPQTGGLASSTGFC